LAKEKRYMKQRIHKSTEHEKAYRKLCNAEGKAARSDVEDWLQEQCKEIKRCAEGKRSRKAYNLINQIN